jgi:hypothetical protein
MTFAVRQYHDLLWLVLEKDRSCTDRTGTGTLSVFGAQTRFDLRSEGPGFPLLTTKKLHIKSRQLWCNAHVLGWAALWRRPRAAAQHKTHGLENFENFNPQFPEQNN